MAKPLTPDTPSDHPPLPPVVDSQALLGNGNEVCIRHQGQIYRLRCTRQGRLILTK